MTRQLLRCLFSVAAITVSACTPEGPGSKHVRKELQATLPIHWKVDGMTLETTENLGTEAEPRVESRFKVVVRLTDNGYELLPDDIPEQEENEVGLLKLLSKKGQLVELYGVSTSVRRADSWITRFRFEDLDYDQYGVPRSKLPAHKRFVEAGSTEEDGIRQEIAERIASQIEADRKVIIRDLEDLALQGQFTAIPANIGPFTQPPSWGLLYELQYRRSSDGTEVCTVTVTGAIAYGGRVTIWPADTRPRSPCTVAPDATEITSDFGTNTKLYVTLSEPLPSHTPEYIRDAFLVSPWTITLRVKNGAITKYIMQGPTRLYSFRILVSDIPRMELP